MEPKQAFETAWEYYKLRRYKRSRKIANELLKQFPKAPRIWHLLALIDYQTGFFGNAATNVSFALKARPHDPEYMNTMALIQIARGRYGRAIKTLKEVLENLDLDETEMLATVNTNLANAFNMSGQYAKAIESFERALEFNPDDPHVHWNIAQLLLLTGDFENGWTGYENRFRILGAEEKFYNKEGHVRWDGRPFPGKRLLVMDEQSPGDCIQFSRYLPSVKAVGGTVIFQVRKPMGGLMQNLAGVDELAVQPIGSEYKGEFDYYIPLASLPKLFTNSVETIPGTTQYIYAEKDKVARWERRIQPAGSDGKKRVGLVWAGDLDNVFLRYRSLLLKNMVPYLENDGVQYLGLQTGRAARQAALKGDALGIVNYGHELEDFQEMAAFIENLDLVICVDCNVAHLAAAMGKPVWLMLAHPPDWRWLLNRDDSPWYPTVRIFRRIGADWDPVFEALKLALEEWLAE